MTASGEIKPKVYVNIGANAFGKITHLYVKEGDRVKEGQMLATLENVQPAADLSANEAALNAAQTDYVAAQAAVNTLPPIRARPKPNSSEPSWITTATRRCIRPS